MAIREDEIAAKAMGINTRNMKLLAFGMGATFGGVSGCDVRVPSRALCRPSRSA
jgi:ABC-type branched-subunit amino acid transport system permease subunit